MTMNKTPLKIAVLGQSTRFHDLLLQFVEKDYHSGMLVEADQADVCIIDLDGYGSEDLLRHQRQQRPDQRVILLAINEPSYEEGIWLKKPLQTRILADTLEKVRNPQHQLEQLNQQQDLKIVVAKKEKQGKRLHEAAMNVAAKHKAQERIVHSVTSFSAKYYEPVEYLQGLLIKAYRQAVTTGITLRIDTGWEPIYVFPHKRLVWVDSDDKKLQAFCHLPIRRFSQLTGELASGPTITPDPKVGMQGIPEPSQRMNAFLWKVSWWNSAGRLPRGVKASQPIRLKRWPNLTRLWCPAPALQIASLLYQRPMTPLAAVKVLKLPPADVFGFISAARAVGLIERVDKEPAPPPMPEPARHSGGLLHRIMRRLRGG